MSLDRGVALFFLLVSLIYGFAAFNYPLLPFERNMAFLPNTLPMVLSVIGAALSLIILVAPRSAREETTAPPRFERANILQALALLAAMLLFALALRPLGFVLATSVFLMACSTVLGERKFHLVVPIAVGSAFLVWYLVQQILGIFMRPWPWFVG